MSCSHADTTTLLWLYGEADESHAEHVAGCAECQAVAADHADVMSALAEVSHLDLAEVESEPLRVANASRWPMAMAVGLVAVAAVALLRFVVVAPEPAPELTVEVAALTLTFDDDIDEQFDDLALELGDLAVHVEEGTL